MCLAIPGKVLSVQAVDGARTARVSFGGIVKEVNLELVPEAGEGDYVLVHVGVALSVVNETDALQTLRYLEQVDGLDELNS